MRSTYSIITRTSSMLLALLLLCTPAFASEMDDNLTVGMISVRSHFLNPLLTLERDIQSATGLVYESLVTINENYDIEPCLAESWETADMKSWAFTLKKDVTFHDGTPLTAYDVAATITEILRLAKEEGVENRGPYASLKFLIKSATANNANTLIIQSQRPCYGFLYALTFPVLKQDQVHVENPVGSGPYKIDSFSPTDYLYMSAYKDYRAKLPLVKNINVLFYKTNQDLTSAFELNQVDAVVTRAITAGQYNAGISIANLPYRTSQLETLLFNLKAPELEDVRVRKAIRHAINVDELVHSAYFGMAERTNTPLPSNTWMHYDKTTEEGANVYTYDVEKAKALLKEAGWEDSDGDGTLDRVNNGKKQDLKLRFVVYEEAENSVRVQAAQLISSMLKQVGIKAPVTITSFTNVKSKLEAVNFDLALASFQMDPVPDPGFMLIGPNVANYGRYKSETMNDYFKELRKAQTKDSYMDYLWKIQDQFGRDCPFMCLYYREGAILSRKVFTNERNIKEPNVLKGINEIGVTE